MKDFLLPIIIVLNASYIYFWAVTIYARRHQHIDRSEPTNDAILAGVSHARSTNNPYLFTIQITTRGGNLQVVQRGINHALKAITMYPALRDILSIEVITEDAAEALTINNRYRSARIAVTAFVLPVNYATPHGTKLKARALHYMVERHRKNPRDAYIVHYDEESVFTAKNLARLVIRLTNKPVGISEGSISYGLDWQDAHLLCRAMESNRPFGCHECYLMMTHPAPLHLHGSNLVVQERLENQIGWDIGQYKGHALIAEDLVFGLMAFQKFGKDVFGWHHVEMIEQPPFTTKAAFKQRERWVLGALQGVNHVRTLAGWQKLSRWQRFKVQVVIRLRVLTYALGLPVSVVSLGSMAWGIGATMLNWSMGVPIHPHFAVLTLPGLCLWLGSTQVGLAQNLRYTGMNPYQKAVEHIKVLCMAPFAGLYDTAGPAVAVAKWCVGIRGINWQVTPKTVQVEEAATPNAAVEVAA